MKKFLHQLIIFGIFLAVVLTSLEYCARLSPDIYGRKIGHIKEHGAEIETLFVGSSLTAYGFDPEYWTLDRGYNAGFPTITFPLVWERLIKATLPHTPSLKRVVLELSYFHLDSSVDSIEMDAEWLNFKRPFFESGKPLDMLAFSSLSNMNYDRFPWSRGYMRVDSFGHVGGLETAKKQLLWNDRKEVEWTLGYVPENREVNKCALDRICVDLRDRGIEIVIVTTPVHPLADQLDVERQLSDTLEFVREMQRKHGVEFIDLYRMEGLTDDDFYDLVHVTSDSGARKFSRELNRRVRELVEMKAGRVDSPAADADPVTMSSATLAGMSNPVNLAS